VGESAGHDGDDIGASLGDPERFAVVFHRHFGAVHGFVARRLGREPADDLAGSVFVEAFAARDRYDRARADARPWLYGIATNLGLTPGSTSLGTVPFQVPTVRNGIAGLEPAPGAEGLLRDFAAASEVTQLEGLLDQPVIGGGQVDCR
jgi:hypothetical protein